MARLAAIAVERRRYHHGNLHASLIEAGLELTRVGGPGALSLRDVTRRLGVSPNAAYRHFADRDALLRALSLEIQQRMADRMIDGSTADPAQPRDARAALRSVGLGYISVALREPGWFQLAFDWAAEDGEPDVSTPPPLARLHEALDALVVAGELDPADRPGAEWPCWAAVHGFALLALRGPLRGRPEAEVWAQAERTVDAIIDGLLSASSEPGGSA